MMQKFIHPAVWLNELRSNLGTFAYKWTYIRRKLLKHERFTCKSMKDDVRTYL